MENENNLFGITLFFLNKSVSFILSKAQCVNAS